MSEESQTESANQTSEETPPLEETETLPLKMSSERRDEPNHDQLFPLTSPAKGERLSAVGATPLADIGGIVSRARDAQAKWSELPIAKRIKAVSKVKRRILSR